MSRVIVLHGKYDEPDYFSRDLPSASNRQWLPWLQNQLLIAGHDVAAPEVYRSYEAHYPTWRAEFERHLAPGPLILVGHSCGAGFLARWLCEHSEVAVEKLALVAPWVDPLRESTTEFFDFAWDDALPDRVGEFHIFVSADDYPSVVHTADLMASRYPDAVVHAYADRGHFTSESLGGEEFPDLLAAIIGATPP